MTALTETIIGILVVSGAVFAMIGGIGLVRMPDVLIRMHASTKIGTLACGLVMAAAAVYFGDGSSVVRAVLIIVFIILTAPIGSHMIGRAAVNTGVPMWRAPEQGGPEDRPMPEPVDPSER